MPKLTYQWKIGGVPIVGATSSFYEGNVVMPQRPVTSSPPRNDIERDIASWETMLQIDENDLDGALLKHPDIFYRVSKALVLQISRRDALKQNCDEVESRVELQIRQDAAEQQQRMREGEVESLKSTNAEVQRVRGELLNAKRTVGLLEALKEAFTQRSYVLKELVALWIANYYSESSSGAANNQRRDQLAERTRAARLRDGI
jgi:hypothetical protein